MGAKKEYLLDIQVGQEFLYQGTRFVKMPPAVLQEMNGREVNAFQTGGGPKLHRFMYFPDNTLVKPCGS